MTTDAPRPPAHPGLVARVVQDVDTHVAAIGDHLSTPLTEIADTRFSFG